MKKYLLLLSTIVLALSFNTAKAQNVIISDSTDDFETWARDPVNGAIYDPNNGSAVLAQWQCLNPLTSPIFGSGPQSVFKDSTIVHSHKYACKIVSCVFPSGGYSLISAFIPHDTVGIVMGGTITAGPSFKLGIPFHRQIATYSFWYQYAPMMNSGKPDTAGISITMTHQSSVDNKTYTVGAGALLMNTTSGNWVQATVNILYDSSASHNPDTIDILWSSSSLYKPAPGSVLYLDGVTIPMGVNEIQAPDAKVEVYPNPASTEVNFLITSENQANNVAVFDITGRKVDTYSVRNNKASVNTSTYSNGMYTYQVRDKSGALIKVGKFSVVR